MISVTVYSPSMTGIDRIHRVAAGRAKQPIPLLDKIRQAGTGIAASALLVIHWSRVRAPPAPPTCNFRAGSA